VLQDIIEGEVLKLLEDLYVLTEDGGTESELLRESSGE